MFITEIKSKPDEDICIVLKLENHSFNYIIDCGEAKELTVKECQNTNAIFISHTHIDHFVNFIKSLKNELNDPLEIAQSNLLILSKYQKFIIPLLGANEYKYRYKLILLFTSRPNQYNMEFVGINNTPQYK